PPELAQLLIVAPSVALRVRENGGEALLHDRLERQLGAHRHLHTRKLDEDEAAAIEAEALVAAVGLRHVQLQLHAAAEPQLRQLTGGPRAQRLPRLVDAGHSLA